MTTDTQHNNMKSDMGRQSATPFDKGAAAAYFGFGVKDCPYQYGTVEAQDWVHGYCEYKRGQL